MATNRKVKTRIEGFEELLRAFSQYKLWFWKGMQAPPKAMCRQDTKKLIQNCPINTRDSDHQNSSSALISPKDVRRKGLSMHLGNRVIKILNNMSRKI